MNEPTGTIGNLRNYYLEFLTTSRWMQDDMFKIRAEWFDRLAFEGKSGALFRFEMMLKGLACFGHPANHPGGTWNAEEDPQGDYSIALGIVLATIEDLLKTGAFLLDESTQTTDAVELFSSSSQGDDAYRIAHFEEEMEQGNPTRSIGVLLSSFRGLLLMVEPMADGRVVSYEQFNAVSAAVYREIIRSSYFNTLSLFEFRMEYDQIKRQQVLTTLSSIENDSSRRVTSIALITVFRMLAYIELLANWDEEDGLGPMVSLLALVRSDGSQFSRFLADETVGWVSRGFADEYQYLTPEELRERYDDLNLQFLELKSLRELLASTGHQLDLELKKLFVQQVPPVLGMSEPAKVMETIKEAMASMRSFLQNATVLFVREFNVNMEGDELFLDFTSDVTRSERLRRDIWMFRQILKAFVAKSKDTESVGDRWVGLNTFKYVRTFVAYFRSMGYQLLRYSDYERFDKFIALIDRLREGDALEVQRLSHIIEECEAFYMYLGQMFEAVGKRKELKGNEFDVKDAARTLQLFIG